MLFLDGFNFVWCLFYAIFKELNAWKCNSLLKNSYCIGLLTDVVLVSEGEEIHAHKLILSLHSFYFRLAIVMYVENI